MKKTAFILFISAVVLCGGSTLLTATDALTGEAIARQVFDRDRGENSISTAVMILENEKGNKRSRTFTNKRILENGLEKQLIRFTEPADINGTGFLTIEKPGYETEQFLYLPALRRSRRIVSSQKSHQFVNSDLTYEDMERHPVENYRYEIKGEKEIDGTDCYILETRPREGIESQYSSITAHIAKQAFVPLFAEYYDKKGRHIKTYRVLGLEQKQNIWTETKIIMEDVASRHKTHIHLEHIEYNTDITPDQVSNQALERF